MTPGVQSSPRTASHLSPEQRAGLRALLLAQQRTNAEQAARHEAAARELAGHTDADSVIERDLAEVCAGRAREAVEQAEQALDRFDTGTYGACVACGAPIPFERLEAIPEARYCVACPGRPAGMRGPSLRGADARRSEQAAPRTRSPR